MGLQRLFVPIAVVIEELCARFDVCLGNQDKPWSIPDHDNLGLAVWVPHGVVQESAQATRLCRGIDAVLFVRVLEVIHVASHGRVGSVLVFSLLGFREVHQVAGILNDEIALFEVFLGLDASALVGVVADANAQSGVVVTHATLEHGLDFGLLLGLKFSLWFPTRPSDLKEVGDFPGSSLLLLLLFARFCSSSC